MNTTVDFIQKQLLLTLQSQNNMKKEVTKTPAPETTQQTPTAAQKNRTENCRFNENLNAYISFLCAVEIAHINAEKIGTIVNRDAKYHVSKILNVQRQFKNFIFDGLTEFQKLELETTIKKAAKRFERIVSVDENGEI